MMDIIPHKSDKIQTSGSIDFMKSPRLKRSENKAKISNFAVSRLMAKTIPKKKKEVLRSISSSRSQKVFKNS